MALLKHALPMLLRPKSEWSVISAKTITPFELYLGYVVPLNIISPVAATVGIVEFIVSSASVPEQWVALYWRATFSSLIASYLWHLIEIYLLAHVANCFAPLFSGERHFLQALKVLAFAMTPICLGQIFLAVPIFSLDKSMVILSLFYSGYLLWLGLSVLMKVQPLKAFLHASIIAMAFWATSEAPKLPRVINEFLSQWPILDQSTRTATIIFGILLFATLTLLYQRGSQATRKTFFLGGILLATLWVISRPSRIIRAVEVFWGEWPSYDESTKTIIAVFVILSVAGLIVLYDKLRRARSNSDG